MAAYSLIVSFLGLLSFKPLELVLSLLMITFVCFFSNILFSKIFRTVPNVESSLITAFILYFLLWPSQEIEGLLLITFAGLIAMASKYIIAYRKKHLFNPAALAAVSLIFFGSGALWWIATPIMLPITVIVGLLIVRKIRKFSLFFTFLAISYGFFLLQIQFRGLNPFDETYTFFTSFPVIFLGTVMLTEPLTMPPTRKMQIVYAMLTGILFSWQGHFGPIILTTELVLIFGNIFSYLVSPKFKVKLPLVEKKTIAKETYELSFLKPKGFSFKPGQYLEWTLPYFKADSRGNRRYFTIASSPTEDEVKLGVKFSSPPSFFKKMLLNATLDVPLLAGQLSGDFVLPNDSSKKLVFIAGGIGVTPFRSMVQYMLDRNEKREVILFYVNKEEPEIAYKDLFDKASKELGIRVIYILSDEMNIPSNWNGEKGRITTDMLKKYVPDFHDRTFYLSGPNAMVQNYKKLLREIGIMSQRIVTDYFPGF